MNTWCDGGQASPPIVGLWDCDCQLLASGEEYCCVRLYVDAPDGTVVQFITSPGAYSLQSDWEGTNQSDRVEGNEVTFCAVLSGTHFLVHVNGYGCNEFEWSQC